MSEPFEKQCPRCGAVVELFRNPFPTVDVVVFAPGRGVVLVRRRNPPEGWALPGGFIDYGETAEQAAAREAFEETGLTVCLTGLLGVYSDPRRDPRMHTLSVVYTAQAENPDAIKGGDDAAEARFHPLERLPEPLAFDHRRILGDFINNLSRHNAPWTPSR